jgi:L-asparaginase II
MAPTEVSGAPPARLVEVLRGGLVESVHRGHLVVVDAEGGLLTHLGDPSFPTFLRSAAKPLQAIPVVEEGAADRYGLSEEELALLCGSVSGQDFHVAAARSALARAGLGEELLACGAQRPTHRPTARRLESGGELILPIHNNCVGKHVGMLLLCAHRGWDPAGYLRPDHPVQTLVRGVIADLCGVRPESMGTGVDGCGVPVFRVPLRAFGWSYARLARPEAGGGMSADRARAIGRLLAAAAAHPEMIAGDEQVDTETMRVGGSSFFMKTGAEASYGIALTSRAAGIAFKVEDGAPRALGPVAIECLRQAGLLSVEEVERLRPFHRPQLRNHRKEVVGELAPVLRVHGLDFAEPGPVA